MEQITLNLIPGGIPQICNASQYDDGRVIRLHLKNGLSDYTLLGTETIRLSVSKSDQTTYVCDVTNTGLSYVDITTASEMCDVSGESECELTISSGDTVLGTGNFRMMVDPDAFDGDLKIKSVSGPIATFETDLAEDLIKLDVDLEPTQDLHGYDNPWPAGGGKNLFDVDTCTPGFLASTGKSISGPDKENLVSDFISVIENQTYSYTSYPTTHTEPWIGWSFYAEKDMNTVIEITSGKYREVSYNETKRITVPSGAKYIRIGARYLDNGGNAQFEKGSTATSFEPYSNVCPIAGHTEAKIVHTGKNLLDTRQESIPQYESGSGTYAGVTYSPNNDASITINGTSTGASVLFFDPVTLNPLTSYPLPTWKYTNNRYTFSVTGGWGSVTGDAYIQATVKKKVDDTIVSRARLTSSVFTRSFTVQEDEYIADAFIRLSSGASASNINIKIQLELGSAATDYEPYESDPTPITVQFGQTVYGGTLDSVSGVLRVNTRYMVFDGTQQIGLANWRPLSNSIGWLYTPSVTPNIKNYEITAANLPNCKLKSNRLQTVVYGGSEGLYGNDTPCISLVGTEYWAIGMRINDPSLTSVTAINNWLSQNPIEVVYELSEPIEIPLSAISPIPALVGTNNVYSDAGDVDVEYYTTLDDGGDSE